MTSLMVTPTFLLSAMFILSVTLAETEPSNHIGNSRNQSNTEDSLSENVDGQDRERICQSSDKKIVDLARSVGHFGWDMYKRMNTSGSDNFVFSPFSVYAVLAMLFPGTKGVARDELKTALHVESSSVRQGYRCYTLTLTHEDGASVVPQVSIANRLYHRQNFSYLSQYQNTISQFYKADVKEENTTETINNWVKKKTQGQITEFLSETSITNDTILMPINVISCSGNWSEQFDSFLTADRPFIVNSSLTVQVETMGRTGFFRKMHHGSLSATSLELSYTGGRFSLFVLLPDQGTSLNSLEQSLSGDVLNTTLNTTVARHLEVFGLVSLLNLPAPILSIMTSGFLTGLCVMMWVIVVFSGVG
ncbi:leukocyte elastase inhibitor [Elysia marginata]|uniref:Leukocyte elastase inhibitor n=1 Tax=Elysia marginata TaxID=1093978 RepID=A0AAV4HCM3_9GAST|nr:leukocyte elastase inhibitor [Elysia marginata]